MLGGSVSFKVDLSGLDCGCVTQFANKLLPAMAADGSLANESKLYFCGNSSLLSNFCPSWNAFAANPWGAETRSNHCGDPNSWGHYATCDTSDVYKNVNF